MKLEQAPAFSVLRRQGRRPKRSAFAILVAIMLAGILVLFVAVLARFALSDMTSERTATLATRAEQIVLSARDWSRAHADQLRLAGEIELPIDQLIPSTASGVLELKRSSADDGQPLIECRLTVRQSRQVVTRHVYWPAS